MATSGDTTYNITVAEIVTEALKHLEVLEEGESASATQVTDALLKFQMMVKAWAAHGLHVWKNTTITISPLVLNQATYEIGPTGADEVAVKPLRILTASIKDNNNNEIDMIRLSLEEYDRLSDKTTDGKPTQYYFEPRRVNSNFTIWPVPDATAVANDTIKLIVQAHIEDVDAGTDDLDLPSEWYEAITYGLAKRLAPNYGTPLEKQYLIRKDAKEALDLVLSFDIEDASVFLVPERDHFRNE